MMLKTCLWLVAVLFLTGCTTWMQVAEPAEAHAYYVSPKGDDGNDGSLRHPFRTLSRAQQAVRHDSCRGKEPLSVIIRGGTYFLTEPLCLEPQDSGCEGAAVTWRSYRGETVIMCSAKDSQPLEVLVKLCGDRRAGLPLEYVTLSGLNFANAQYAIRAQDVMNCLIEQVDCTSCRMELGNGSRESIVYRCRWSGEVQECYLHVAAEDCRILNCKIDGNNGHRNGMVITGRGNVVRFCDLSHLAGGVYVSASCTVVENSRFSHCDYAVKTGDTVAGTIIRANDYEAISVKPVDFISEAMLVEPIW